MRFLVVIPLLFAHLALADVAKPVAPPVAPVAHDTARADVGVEVKLDELEAAPAPAYDRSRWLLLLPLLCALVVAWNVDWRELRVRAELAASRASRAPRKPGAP